MDYPADIKALLYKFNNDWRHVDTPADWFPFIVSCDKELTAIDPQYTIAQIKEKFGGLRYYFSTTIPEKYKEMQEVTFKWEKKVFEYERSKNPD